MTYVVIHVRRDGTVLDEGSVWGPFDSIAEARDFQENFPNENLDASKPCPQDVIAKVTQIAKVIRWEEVKA